MNSRDVRLVEIVSRSRPGTTSPIGTPSTRTGSHTIWSGFGGFGIGGGGSVRFYGMRCTGSRWPFSWIVAIRRVEDDR